MVRDSTKLEKTQPVACPYCHGFFSKKSINRHVKQSCKAEKRIDYLNITGIARVKASIANAEQCRPELINDIFPFLNKESQRNVILKDPTAISFGNTLIEKHFLTNLGGKHVHIAQQLRLLADLFNSCKLEVPEIQEIKDMFHPRYFNTIIKAIKTRAGYFYGKFNAPTTATSSCTLITKIIEHLKTRAIMSSDTKYEEALTKLEYLINHNRNNIITKIAGENRTELQRARLEKLPTTADVKKLMQVLETEFNAAYNAAKKKFDRRSYSRLCKAILAYIMAFNRKRPGDCQKALVLEFQNAATVDKDCLANLKDTNEKNRAASFYRFVTQGKLNKKASNLITKPIKEAIDFLLQRRIEINISSQNRFLFANPKGKRVNYFKADECLKDICNRYNLKYQKLTGNKLRKHLATNTVMLPSEKQSLISNFMGHSMDVHKNIYQQSLVRNEVITISQLLLESAGLSNSESFTAHQQPMEYVKNDYIIMNTNMSTKGMKKLVVCITPLKPKSGGPIQAPDSGDTEVIEERNLLPRYKNIDIDSNNDPDYKEESDDSEIVVKPRKVKRRIRTYDKCLNPKKSPWSTPERHTVRSLFGTYINRKTLPSLTTIVDLLSKSKIGIFRPPHIVKAWIAASINKAKLVEGNYF